MEIRSILIDSIQIFERQRTELKDIDLLAESITRDGLWHPIVMKRDGTLVAGFRRLTACKKLGWTHISAHIFEEMSARQQFRIEFNENEKRQSLLWHERAQAIEKYHQLAKTEEGKNWTQDHTAADLGITRGAVSQFLIVAPQLENPQIRASSSIETAFNTAKRLSDRKKADEAVYTDGTLGPNINFQHPIQHGNFNEWAPAYSGQPFNLIHCDFPYGINAHKSEGQNSALEVGYDDSPWVFWKLVETLYLNQDRIIAPSAHMIFWFSPNIYCEVWEILNEELRGFRWDEHPLIWMRGENEGIAPDPNRRPRRCYEMAFFGWRGDRPIIKTKANIFQAPTTRKDHPHEKSELALRHFFEMCVDSGTRLLDPTCGSASALRAAKYLARECSVLGLEANPEYLAAARRAFDSGSGIGPGGQEGLLDSMVRGAPAGQGNGAIGGGVAR